MERARRAGRLLAQRHASSPAEPDRTISLINHAESPRTGDWSLRSAMVRLALPEPMLVVDIATLVRRLDAVLHTAIGQLEKHTVVSDRAISLDHVADDHDAWTVDGPVDPYPDVRIADIARLTAVAGDAVIDGYVEVAELTEIEQRALPLLGVAVVFDGLADTLTGWALVAPAAPPVDEISSACREVQHWLDELGVPVEEAPPGRGRRRG